jgi:aerobic-type carbon monoxide dehydrogenase small subunit (CoxS/CutS family)
MRETIRFRLNGRATTLETEGDRSLLWVLRTDLGLTGTKYGCGITACGACTVLVDGQPVRSCRFPVARVLDTDVTTIEGLARDGELHPLQDEFARRGALQCGYCTSGMILQAWALLNDNPSPTRDEIVAAMNRNLCRCGAHVRILDAIEAAAART